MTVKKEVITEVSHKVSWIPIFKEITGKTFQLQLVTGIFNQKLLCLHLWTSYFQIKSTTWASLKNSWTTVECKAF